MIQTYTGRFIDPLDPRPDDIDLFDIAHALANACRFTGHTRHFYSVAQHAVYVSYCVPPEDALAGLMHDASEAYLCDVASPVKHRPAFSALYRPAEDRLMTVIAAKFGFAWPLSAEIKRADDTVMRSEARDLMHRGSRWWDSGELVPWTIIPSSPPEAEARFIGRFFALTRP